MNLKVLLMLALSVGPLTCTDVLAKESPIDSLAQINPSDQTETPQLRGAVSFTLPDLERMAEESNPTLFQADTAIWAARGRAKQAGLWPNPVVGFEGTEWPVGRNARYFDQRSEHFGFVEQTIVLGGKLPQVSGASTRKRFSLARFKRMLSDCAF